MTKKLRDYKEGSAVTIGGQDWIVLEQGDDGETFCLRKDYLEEPMPFDKGNYNNWATSNLRASLNGEYKIKLQENLPDVGDLLDTIQDLTADDGTEHYGMCADKVTLLTCDQYRRYRNHFPILEKPWWLLTADSTTNSSVRIADGDGTIYSAYARNDYCNVRPACTFRSSIPIEEDVSHEMARFIVKNGHSCPFPGKNKGCHDVFGQKGCISCIIQNAHLLNDE